MKVDDLQRNLFGGYCMMLVLGVSAVALNWYDLGKDEGEAQTTNAIRSSLDNGEFVIGPMFERYRPDARPEFVEHLNKLKAEAELKAAMLDKNVSMEECVSKVRVLMDCDKAVQLVKEKIAEENKETAKEEA